MNGPQDTKMDGFGLRIETLEHDEMCVPHAIRVTDSEGRSAIYFIGEEHRPTETVADLKRKKARASG